MSSERCHRCWNLKCTCGKVYNEPKFGVEFCRKETWLPTCDCLDNCDHDYAKVTLNCDRDAGHTGPHRDPEVGVFWQKVE